MCASRRIADKVSTVVAKADDYNKQCEGKGTPADIDHCKKCSVTPKICILINWN